MKTLIRSIVRKELLVILRASRWQNLAAIIMPVVVQVSMMQRFIKAYAAISARLPQTSGSFNLGPAIILLYVAPMVIPVVATSLLTRSFSHEKVNGGLAPILATGVDPGLLWTVKTLAIFAYCYVAALAVTLLDAGILTLYFKVPVAMPLKMVCLITIISPIAALAITALMSFLYWTVKVGAMMAGMLPMAVIVALLSFTRTNPTTTVMLQVVVIVTVAAATVLLACALIISRMSRARILGV